ncbi:DUF4153 domain-containing protein [Dyadobacter sp. CY323]|uniref:DUF4153 domain-containing protein n=1 Tax=Dyadobacter sp. CY323 TaxID=2907302 RepID=UPI001F3F896E|nr:DUF4153 domain-containing protein [Dyadobacter sp. CY323]MCE6989043.1 DUF4153 domain-containing protein [Dyadobacter sp. CY323]
MIKLASLQTISDDFFKTISRFKWVAAAAICKTAVLLRLAETTGDLHEQQLMVRLSFVVFLAVPLTLAIQLLSERKQWKPAINLGLNISVILILIAYYFSIGEDPNLADTYVFGLFMVGAHLIVAYAPFLASANTNGFWQYNKTLFLQFLNASLYSITLFIGLIIAVETIKFLFNVTYLFKAQQDLFIVISVFFHTIFFLSKIPENLDSLENEDSYPSGLKIFTQYVLLPLEVVYMVILYAYTIKIIFEWKLPDGGVAYLVMAFSIAGILALLLLHPLRENAKEKWVRLFSRRFYIALLPLIFLLFIGIFRRIHDYGMTENRIIIAVLAFWLAGTTLYFLLHKRADIRWIPLSLSALSIVLVIGPWNIFAVSRKSQLRQFQEILANNKLLDKKNQIAGKATISNDDYNRLTSIIQFHRTREIYGLEPYFVKLKPKLGTTYQHYVNMEEVLAKHITSNGKSRFSNENYVNFSSKGLGDFNRSIEIDSLTQMRFFNLVNGTEFTTEKYKVTTQANGRFIHIHKNNKKLVTWDLSKTTARLRDDYGSFSDRVPVKSLTVTLKTDSDHIVILFQYLNHSGEFYSGEAIMMYR